MNGKYLASSVTLIIIGFLLLSPLSSIAEQDEAKIVSNEIPTATSMPSVPDIEDLSPEDEPIEQEDPAKVQTVQEVIISLADQRMWVLENDQIINRFPVSTGKRGHRTPTGEYKVCLKAPRAYSRRYKCYMLKWMAITKDGLFGMHALEGTSYEKYLGRVASHGCIRLSHKNAGWMYDWVHIGTKVKILDDWDEPVIYTKQQKKEMLLEYPFHW